MQRCPGHWTVRLPWSRQMLSEKRSYCCLFLSHSKLMVRLYWHACDAFAVRCQKGNGTACDSSQRLAWPI